MKAFRNFIRNNKKIVLLVCDFYETKHIPLAMTEKKENLALFPVANVPLIEYILNSLYHQRLKNIVMVSSEVSSVFEYVKTTEFFNIMKIISLICDGSNLGDIIREIDDADYCGGNLLVLYANHYTNYDLRRLFKEHKKNKSLITFFLHENMSNNKVSHFYGTKDSEIVFYKKCINGNFDQKHVADSLEKYEEIRYNINLSSPTIAVISPDVFPLFTANFDFTSFGDLLEGLLAFNPYKHRLGCIETTDKDLLDMFSSMNLNNNINYNREIITLNDYFKFNEDVLSGKFEDILDYKQNFNGELRSLMRFNGNYLLEIPVGYTNLPFENSVLGSNIKFEMDIRIKDSFVGNGCSISGNINKCIVWEDINVTGDLSEHIIFSDGQVMNYHHLEEEHIEEKKEEKETNFFDDVSNYLKTFVKSGQTKQININEIVKQINILRIFWNASEHDFIEAFALFLTDIIIVDDIEGSTINGSVFFDVLYVYVNDPKGHEELLENIYNIVKDEEFEYKKEVLFRYGYMLVDDEVLPEKSIKKYYKMIKKGLF